MTNQDNILIWDQMKRVKNDLQPSFCPVHGLMKNPTREYGKTTQHLQWGLPKRLGELSSTFTLAVMGSWVLGKRQVLSEEINPACWGGTLTQSPSLALNWQANWLLFYTRGTENEQRIKCTTIACSPRCHLFKWGYLSDYNDNTVYKTMYS